MMKFKFTCNNTKIERTVDVDDSVTVLMNDNGGYLVDNRPSTNALWAHRIRIEAPKIVEYAGQHMLP